MSFTELEQALDQKKFQRFVFKGEKNKEGKTIPT